MFTFVLRPEERATRDRILREVALRLGRTAQQVRAQVDEQIDAAIESGDLIEKDGHISTSGPVVNWVMHTLPSDESPKESTEPEPSSGSQ